MGYPFSRGMIWVPLPRENDGVPPVGKDWGTPHQDLMGVPLPISGCGYPPKVGQIHTCENIASRHPSDAGGKNKVDCSGNWTYLGSNQETVTTYIFVITTLKWMLKNNVPVDFFYFEIFTKTIMAWIWSSDVVESCVWHVRSYLNSMD